MKLLQPFFATVGTLVLATASLHGQTYTEIGDAPSSGAQSTGTNDTDALTTIFGSIFGGNDADLYAITITNTTTFSATTTLGTLNLDTALFLFDLNFNAIYANDDATGATTFSTLPAGSTFTMTLSPGTYYLGISLSGNEPTNSNGQLLFLPYPGGDSTAVRGAAAGLNPSSLSNFNSQTSFAETGNYRIDLVGTATSAIPEPSTTAFCFAAAAALGVIIRKRRKAGRFSA